MFNYLDHPFRVTTRTSRRPTPIAFAYLRKTITPSEIHTILHTLNQYTNIEDILNQLTNYYVSNILQFVFSVMVARSNAGFTLLKCTEDGALHTAPASSVRDAYEVFTGAGSDAFVESSFAQQVDVVDIFTYDKASIVKYSRDLVAAYGSEIKLFTDSFYTVNVKTQRVSIKNATAGENAAFYLVGWYKT